MSDDIPLKEYVEARLDAMQKQRDILFESSRAALAAAITAQKEAVVKVEIATEKRFESVNEFRSTLADQQRTFMPRIESERVYETIAARVTRLEQLEAQRTGQKSGLADGWGWAIAVLMFMLAMAEYLRSK